MYWAFLVYCHRIKHDHMTAFTERDFAVFWHFQDFFFNLKKMENVFDRSWEPKVSVTVSVCQAVICQMVNVDPCDMMKNFSFHV